MHSQPRIRVALLALFGLVVLTGCMAPKAPITPPSWTDVFVSSLVLRAEMADPPVQIKTSRTDDGTLLTFASGLLQSRFILGYRNNIPAVPGKLMTVTEHTVIVELSRNRREQPRRWIAEAADLSRYDSEMSTDDAPALPEPLRGTVSFVKRCYLQYAVENLDAAPDDATMARIAPGKMVLLTDANGVLPDRLIRQERYVPSNAVYEGEQRPAPEVDLAAESRLMDHRLRDIFARTVGAAIRDRAYTVEERRALMRDALPELKEAIFAYTGHTGPAFAAGEHAYEEARRHLARVLALDPGYNA